MAQRNTIVLFAITVLLGQALADKTKVEIFYETHCPDSQDIIRYGLRKSLDLLGEVDIELVPYGKADTTGQNNSLSFRCQHGQKECDGNTYHACAIDIHPDKKQVLQFVICTMSNRQNVLETIEQCAERNQIDYTALKVCFSSSKGRELLAKMGQKTRDGAKIINGGPRLDFVPSTIIDGTPRVFESYPDLRRAICNHANHKPSKCSEQELLKNQAED